MPTYGSQIVDKVNQPTIYYQFHDKFKCIIQADSVHYSEYLQIFDTSQWVIIAQHYATVITVRFSIKDTSQMIQFTVMKPLTENEITLYQELHFTL